MLELIGVSFWSWKLFLQSESRQMNGNDLMSSGQEAKSIIPRSTQPTTFSTTSPHPFIPSLNNQIHVWVMDSHQDTSNQEAHKAWKPPQYAFPSSQSEATSKLLFTIRPQETEQTPGKDANNNIRKRKRDSETLNARREEKIWRKAIWWEGILDLSSLRSSSLCLLILSEWSWIALHSI